MGSSNVRAGLDRRSLLATSLLGVIAVAAPSVQTPAAATARDDPPPQERARMRDDHVELSNAPVKIKLKPTSEGRKTEGPTVPETVRRLAGDRRLYLVLRDFRTNVQPGVTYDLYLDLPPDAPDATAAEHHVGTVNFFGAVVAEDPSRAEASEEFVSFDVTKLLKTLSSRGKLADSPTLSIVPSKVPAPTARPWIGEVKLLEQ